MMFHRLGSIDKNQKGFTLVELLIALAITAVIAGSVTTAIFQVFTGNARTSNHMTAVRQVQNAGYWVSHDTQMAQNIYTANLTGSDKLKLNRTRWDGSTENVTYSIVSGQLWRYSENTSSGTPPVTTVSTSVVAQYIDPTATSYNFTNDLLIFTVKATVGSAGSQQGSETRVYEVVPRPY
jgi:prepilin-type N-terminal cleavage/methylation domain-containing protein